MKTMEVKSVLNKIRNKKENKNGIYNIRLIEGEEGILSNEKGNIILIVVFGQGSITIDSKVINLFSGNIILLKQVGEIKYNIKDKNEICFVKLKKEFITTQLIAQMADCPILYDFLRLDTSQMEYLLFDITMQEVVKTYLNILLYELSSNDEENYKLVKASLILFLTNLHKVHQEALIISESSMMKDYDIGKWLKYMVDNYSTVTLRSMAEHFNFNPTYFSVRFKVLANCQFSEKLLEIKLEKARWLLVTTNLTVQNIVEMIGFKEKSYFYRVFKKQYKMTPLQYRKHYKLAYEK
ncbi:helix-turn-helix transcriptional regulator [Clostridium sp. NSJ-49]|uniref:helix-turn-helix transcriptional regulator n=1 Tax=Clostridium TaxID=1485 RepID=UPI00164C813F|nr:response regulator transcription factor [Clostridium sp. NSJ-49]MBC5626329.1 helix-turn-helix transcriptional regulator [Clostridium sp. NSJ-49]